VRLGSNDEPKILIMKCVGTTWCFVKSV